VRTIHAAKDFNELIKLVGVIMARAPFLAPRLQHRPDAACAGDLHGTSSTGDEAHAVGFDSVMGERCKRGSANINAPVGNAAKPQFVS